MYLFVKNKQVKDLPTIPEKNELPSTDVPIEVPSNHTINVATKDEYDDIALEKVC